MTNESYFTSSSDEPHDCGKSTPSLVTFVLRHHVVKVTSSVFQPAMSTKRMILSLDQRIEVLCLLGEAHHVERLLPSQCGKTHEMARMIWKQTGLPPWPKLNTSIRVLYNTSAVICCVDFRFSNHSLHNYDNAYRHIQNEYRWW